MKNNEIIQSAFSHSINEIVSFFKSNIKYGLTSAQVQENRKNFGSNTFPPKEQKSVFSIIVNYFQQKLVILLIFAIIINYIYISKYNNDPKEISNEFTESLTIIIIIIFDFTWFILENSKVETNIEELDQFNKRIIKVIRDAKIQKINFDQVVCGDIVEIGKGQQIPCDIRIIKIISPCLKCDESSLGETKLVTKNEDASISNSAQSNKNAANMCFAKTFVVSGSFQGIVVAVGNQSEIAKIKQRNINNQQQMHIQTPKNVFVKILVEVFIILLLSFNILLTRKGIVSLRTSLSLFKIFSSILFVSFPGSFSNFVRSIFSYFAHDISKENILFTSLSSIEDLGNTNVIICDKEGIITSNHMVAKEFLCIEDNNLNIFEFEGNDYNPLGKIKAAGSNVTNLLDHHAIQESAKISTLCNEANLFYDPDTNTFSYSGEALEASLKVFAEKIGVPDADLNTEISRIKPEDRPQYVSNFYRNKYQNKQYFNFSDNVNINSIILDNNIVIIKGPHDDILPLCNKYLNDKTGEFDLISLEIRQKIETQKSRWLIEKNFYCIGLAFKHLTGTSNIQNFDKNEKGFIWTGTVGIFDPLHESISSSFIDCELSKIHNIMFTNDEYHTAVEISKQIKLINDNENIKGMIFSESQWNSISNEEKNNYIKNVVALSHFKKESKIDLIKTLQNQGSIVTFVGNNMDDVEILQTANIGVTIKSGTNIAQENSDAILIDNSFSTLCNAIKHIKMLHFNISAISRFNYICSIGKFLFFFPSSLIGLSNIFHSNSILLVHLLFHEIMLSILKINAPKNYYQHQINKEAFKFVSKFSTIRTIISSIYFIFAAFVASFYYYIFDPNGPRITILQLFSESSKQIYTSNIPSTMCITTIIFLEILLALSAISETKSVFVIRIWSNRYLILITMISLTFYIISINIPFLQDVLHLAPLNLNLFLFIFVLSFPILIIDEIFKAYMRNNI